MLCPSPTYVYGIQGGPSSEQWYVFCKSDDYTSVLVFMR
jgi:hypothetical protein